MYEQGEGVKRNMREAVMWYGLAASHGNAEALFKMGLMYETGSGLPRDICKSHRILSPGDPAWQHQITQAADRNLCKGYRRPHWL